MKQILIIDDAATVRMYHRGVLQQAGYGVHEAVNGVEALEKAMQTAFDLYIVDINMPKLDGYRFLQELRASSLPQAPAIMVSTEAEGRDRTHAWESGANAYLVKPSRPAQLVGLVKVLLGESCA